MANCFHLCLMTAEGTMVDEAAEYCRIPTADGSVGILADHAPMLCAVCEGEVRCRMEDGRERSFHVPAGVASVRDNSVTILTDRAEERQSR
ncbi:MAG: F0F1 ATP synthase subunit epsilon [Oscillospiraceae bacterium]|nr:F0F1 ATP synthase subunit epsilon [Oscillospiraceae bacterium]